MSSCWILHLRALAGAAVHFFISAALGATVMLLAMMDALASPGEGPPPWWLSAMDWGLQVLSVPMANFFGLLDSSHMMSLPSLLLAACWSVFVGYAISVIWQRIEKTLESKHEPFSV